jgi:peptidoglycan-associated lipoprotein
MKSRFLMAVSLGALALSLTGCPPKAQVKKEPTSAEQEADKNKPVEEPSLRGKEYKEVPDLVDIYFDLDQSTLRADAREILRKNYDALRNHTDWEVLIEGHCDERGTTEYNIALGQRRAATVRQYYVSLGISGSRIATLSYGKEKPMCEEHNDACWSKNRRAATKARMTEKASEK